MLMTDKPDLATVLEYYGINVLDRHGWQSCKCVIHDDAHSSAAYNLDTQGYNCLVCNVLGDVYTLVKEKEGIEDFRDVVTRAEAITNGNRAKVSQRHKSGNGLLPARAGNNKGSRRYVPAWNRK